MAKNLGNNKIQVQKGDTLWGISATYFGGGKNYQQLAKLNNIPNPNLIYVGQIIDVSGKAAGGSSGGSSTAVNTNVVANLKLGELSSADNTLVATWDWNNGTTKETQTAKYVLEWTYDTGDGITFIDIKEQTVNEYNPAASRQVTYSIPNGARTVWLRIKPIAKEKDSSNNTKSPYWDASWCGKVSWTNATPVDKPTKPSIKIEKFVLTTGLENLTIKATHAEFNIYKDGSVDYNTSGKLVLDATKSVSYTYNVDAGGKYKVRCRLYDGNLVSEWSEFTDEETTIPNPPSEITKLEATSKTSVRLTWDKVDTADKYEIEYTTETRYFDGSKQATSEQVDSKFEDSTVAAWEIVGLATGDEYFFRVRAVNGKGNSSWSAVSSITIGEKPSAPTTWSSTTTPIVGEPLTLYWAHNSVDNSSQTRAELELIIDGKALETTISINNVTDEDERDKTSKVQVDTTTGVLTWIEDKTATHPDGVHTYDTGYDFVEGVKIQWRVKTAGVTNEFGDWSVQRTIDLYASPHLDLSIHELNTSVDENGETVYKLGNEISTLTKFPFGVRGLASPNTQAPVGFHLSIKADEYYETVDNLGNDKIVNKNAEVYSKYFDITSELVVMFTPGNIDLENGISYTVTCTVTMNSGLTAQASKPLTVSWSDAKYSPNAEIGYDTERYVTYISPYCNEYTNANVIVEKNNSTYTVTTDELSDGTYESVYTKTGEEVFLGIRNGGQIYYCISYVDSSGKPIDPTYYRVTKGNDGYTVTTTRLNVSSISKVTTTTGEEVFLGVLTNGTEIYYSTVTNGALVEGVTLSVYRREFDGGFTEIMTGIDNTKNTFVVDPHPALDYARYRIVAVDDATGAISYYDMPGYPIGEVGIIIQWDEQWTSYDTDGTEPLAQPPWTGSLLRIPYNIDVSDSNSRDVVLVNYIGRKRPVSYYGTQLGEKSTWNVVIPKEDKETLYALRRLSLWMGDVYVREPSGSGYWANISVTFNQKHLDVTIPVTFDITRVEGGV